MASEYLLKKYRDVKPAEKRELTKAEKRKNWWHYHKWHVIIALILLIITVDLICSYLGIGETEPDYQVAYVANAALPEDTAEALRGAIEVLGMDLNGDGEVLVQINQYTSTGGEDAGVYTASEVQLTADIVECESYFFLLEDPETFQFQYHSLCYLNGELPAEDDNSAENCAIKWSELPAMAGVELGDYSYSLMGETVSGNSDELVGKLYIARRGFWTEETVAYPEGCAELWNELTKGAIS